MPYIAKDYAKLIGMSGFSETLLKNHFTLYNGYVNNTNKLLDTLHQMVKVNETDTPQYAELKRRLGWEFNGMRLHELYFENLGGKGQLDKSSELVKSFQQDFGGFENWEKHFKAAGMMRGIGWSILYQDVVNGRLINFWINEHDTGHPAGCNPLLVMDVWEHAFMTDYQLKKGEYISAFMKNINWTAVENRLERYKPLIKMAA